MRLHRVVALKLLTPRLLQDEAAVKRFEREAEAAARLSHPNITTIYEIDEEDGARFLALEHVEGESLERLIENGPLPLTRAVEIVRQIASGLELAHEKGVVHRDIKPSNILVTPNGQVKILDFGLALLAETSRLTKLDETVGTVAYMSPEQAQGGEVDRRADIWALGCVLYEMVRGERPFPAAHDQALIYEICNEAPEPLTAVRAGVPMALELLVGKCLAKDGGDRYQNVTDLIVDLRRVGETLESGRSRVSSAASESMPDLAAARRASSWAPWAAAAGLLAAIAAALAFVHFMEPPAPPADRAARRFSFTPDSLYDIPGFMRVAVSPDGGSIAYVSGDDPTALWLRAMDDEEPRKLEGTEGAVHGFFWSADSRFIGFVAGGDLKKVAVDGGPPVMLCKTGGSFFEGGSWSPDGESIVFASVGGAPGIYEVPARGGEPRLLFDPAPGPKGQGDSQPHFLPSKTPALLLARGSFYARDIFLINLETGDATKLAEGARPLYSATGHILYRTGPFEAGLWALPFSLETLRATGDAVTIADGVGDASLAADGTLVTVDHTRAKERGLIWRDRSGKKLGEIGRPQASIRHPALSPDGRRVAVEGREDRSDAGDIWLHETDRPISQRLTFDPARDSHPAWSPGGEIVGFASERTGDGDLYERRADGSGAATVIASGPRRATELDWSPDGFHLLFRSNTGASDDLWLLSRANEGAKGETQPFLESPFLERTPQFSSDGRYVAYVSNESGVDEVYVREFPRGESRWQVSENGGRQPRWSAGGAELFYVDGSTLTAVRVELDPVFKVGEADRLFSDRWLTGVTFAYDVSADGRFVMVEEATDDAAPPRKPAIRIVQNWYEEFRVR